MVPLGTIESPRSYKTFIYSLTNSLNCSDLELHLMSLPDVLNLSWEVKNKLFEKLHLMTLDDLDLILTFSGV